MSSMEAADDENGDYLWGARHALIYRIELSTLYHHKRERFFEMLDKGGKAVSVLGGSAALANLASRPTLLAIGVAITATSTLSLVAGLSDRSKRHAELARNFRNLEAEVIAAGERDFTEAQLSSWAAKERSLEASEPPALSVLIVVCQNELAAAAGSRGKVVPLPFLKRLTKNWINWSVPMLPAPAA